MDVFDRSIEKLIARRQRILDGLINCIPLSFPRLRKWLPGIEKRRYTIITANQKIGKSKLADYLYIYEPFFYMIEHPDQLRAKVLYFTLEMGKEEKFYEFLCHLLYRLDGIRISPTNLKSTDADRPCPEEILTLIKSEKYQEYITKFKDMVTYIDDIRNPTGIYKKIRSFMLERGRFHYKKGKIKDDNGLTKEVDVIDYYEPDDKDEYVVVIMDNYSNLNQEQGLDKRGTIEKMSKYSIELRDKFDLHICAIQHQAQAQEGIENQKLNKLYPSSDGLADCKTTTRDANLVLGLFSPFKYGLETYEQYDITKFKNNIRFLLVIEDRDNGAGGQVCPLFFDGEVSSFNELPLPDNKREIQRVLSYIEQVVRQRANPVFLMPSIDAKKTVKSLHRYSKWSTFAAKLKKRWQEF